MIKNKNHYQLTMEKLNNSVGIFVVKRDGSITYTNDQFCHLLKYKCEELVGQSCQILDVKESTSLDRLYHLVLKRKEWKGELNFQTKEGQSKWFFVHLLPIFEQRTIVKELIVIADEITEKKLKRIEGNRELDSLIKVKNALDKASIVAITNKQGIITYVNEKFCKISKYSEKELIGQNHRIINSGFHSKSFFKDMWATIGQGKTWNGEVKNKAKDGSYYWMNTTIVPVLNQSGKPEQYISIRTDITDRIEAENKLKIILQNDFKKVVQNLENWVFKVVKTKGRYRIALSEGKLAEYFNLETAKIENTLFSELFDEKQKSDLYEDITRAFTNEVITREFFFRNKYLNMTLSPVETDGEIIEVVGSMIDMTERKKAEDMIYYMAHYDTLTGLINRPHFVSLLEEEISCSEKHNKPLSLLFIDLDRFKSINDSLGHLTGDKVLRQISSFFKDILRPQDIISRQGGDEFLALLPNTSRNEAEHVTRKIIKRLSQPLHMDHLDLYITASIGISTYPSDGHTVDDLIKSADTAMYLAKKSGKNTYAFYTKDLEASMLNRLHLENDLRKAIENEQLELYYQPKINILSGKIKGVEALIRWNHPSLGIVPPDQFISIAEETGEIVKIGQWVIEEACKQIKCWQDKGHDGISVAVNISFRQFLQNDLHDVIAQALESSQLDPKYLEIEITESMTADANHTIESLNKIKALGVKVSIDDFGTGYSSLSYLSKFPVDRLKIDKSFVMNLTDDNKAIIKSIIDVAHNLGIKVIAEGVETEDHLQFLASQNCSEAQGFYFSKPLPINQIEEQFVFNS